jgi:hypothetical protein
MSGGITCLECEEPILFGFALQEITGGKKGKMTADYCILCFQKKAESAAKLAQAAAMILAAVKKAREMEKPEIPEPEGRLN